MAATKAAAHMTASGATCLCIGRKQAAGQHRARQDQYRSFFHNIILSTELRFRRKGSHKLTRLSTVR
jgi:hypothetical protein